MTPEELDAAADEAWSFLSRQAMHEAAASWRQRLAESQAEVERLKAALVNSNAALHNAGNEYEDQLRSITRVASERDALRSRVAELSEEIRKCRGPCRDPLVVRCASANVCRICGQPPISPTILNYGKEYACEKCFILEQTP